MKDKKKSFNTLFFILREGILITIFTVLLVYSGSFSSVKAAQDKGIQIININESHFKGYLILVKDPKRIAVGVTPNLGQAGATLKEIIQSHNAVGGINAGGFVDVNLMGNGGKPIGILINNNKIVFKQSGLNKFSVTGFNNNNVLITSNSMTLNEIKNNNLRCVASFGPALIVGGKPLVVSGGGSLQPRSAIGQRKDGTVLLLAIDGRQLRSKGANYHDLQKLLLKYGAYTAANLDGGSSTTLVYQGKTLNNPSDITGERSLPSAFLILPDNINKNKTLSSIYTASDHSKASAVIKIPTDATNISFSYDNKYCVYLNKGIIYIQEIGTNKIIQEIIESTQITKAVLMEDRNIVIYFTNEKKSISNSKTINISTYNIDKNEKTFQQSLSINSSTAIKDIQYSSLTNLILISTENQSINSLSDKVLFINIMKHVSSLVTEKNVNNMVLLNKSFSLYYQNDKSILYCNANKVKTFDNQRVNLLGRDSKDNLYVQSLIKKNTIYVFNNNRIIKTLKLSDPNYIKILFNRPNIYVVYKGYVVNLTSNINKKINYGSNYNFVDIVGQRIYMKDKNNKLTIDIISNNF